MARRDKKRTVQAADSLDRWLISYADFMTLLFAFFVVLFSLSTIDANKMRNVANSISTALNASAFLSARPGQLPESVQVVPRPLIVGSRSVADDDMHAAAEKMKEMAEEVRRVLSPLISAGDVRVGDNEAGIQIDINAKLLFQTGQADLDPAALPALRSLAEVIAPASFAIKVEGHTDNIAIATTRFPSNWELSAARASRVVRVLGESGVDGKRLSAAGYAEQRPVADNATPEGRMRNRRVAIIIAMPAVKKSASALGLGQGIVPLGAALPPGAADLAPASPSLR